MPSRWSKTCGEWMGWPIRRVLSCRSVRSCSGGHPSTNAVAGALQRPTRTLGRAALDRALSGLAPGGVYLAAPVTRCAGGLLHHRFTLTPSGRAIGAVYFLWHLPAGHPEWALPTTLPCGARTFLGRSSKSASHAAAWPTHPHRFYVPPDAACAADWSARAGFHRSLEGRVLRCLFCFRPLKEKRRQPKGARSIWLRWHFPR